MDAGTFYGSARLREHSLGRQKASTSSAQALLARIADGDVSDGDFSDDEVEECAGIVTSSEEPVAAHHSVSSSDEDEKENVTRLPPKRKKTQRHEPQGTASSIQ
ncbi:hypothetical protein V5799_003395 [Amblyomma americanum]|uniref:Uncharacterized protein n=1 Tax=Amblyomma americanum TaxID=6943 RepID=A0AAQ4D930_AMBAM